MELITTHGLAVVVDRDARHAVYRGRVWQLESKPIKGSPERGYIAHRQSWVYETECDTEAEAIRECLNYAATIMVHGERYEQHEAVGLRSVLHNPEASEEERPSPAVTAASTPVTTLSDLAVALDRYETARRRRFYSATLTTPWRSLTVPVLDEPATKDDERASPRDFLTTAGHDFQAAYQILRDTMSRTDIYWFLASILPFEARNMGPHQEVAYYIRVALELVTGTRADQVAKLYAWKRPNRTEVETIRAIADRRNDRDELTA